MEQCFLVHLRDHNFTNSQSVNANMELMQYVYKINENFDKLETIVVLDHPLQVKVARGCHYRAIKCRPASGRKAVPRIHPQMLGRAKKMHKP